MGRDFYATDAAFGFQPYGPILRTGMYAIATAPTINIYHFDLVRHGGTMVSTPHHGYLPIIEDSAVPDGGTNLLGSVLAIFDENMEPQPYIAAAEAGNSTIAGYILVADHPQQLYVAQEDGEGNAIDLAESGNNADIISATLCAGDSNTGLSTQEIDSDTASATAALNVRLIRPHEDDTPADDTYHYARWIVMINEHHFGATAAGI